MAFKKTLLVTVLFALFLSQAGCDGETRVTITSIQADDAQVSNHLTSSAYNSNYVNTYTCASVYLSNGLQVSETITNSQGLRTKKIDDAFIPSGSVSSVILTPSSYNTYSTVEGSVVLGRNPYTFYNLGYAQSVEVPIMYNTAAAQLYSAYQSAFNFVVTLDSLSYSSMASTQADYKDYGYVTWDSTNISNYWYPCYAIYYITLTNNTVSLAARSLSTSGAASLGATIKVAKYDFVADFQKTHHVSQAQINQSAELQAQLGKEFGAIQKLSREHVAGLSGKTIAEAAVAARAGSSALPAGLNAAIAEHARNMVSSLQ